MATVTALDEADPSLPLQRSVSQHSSTSLRSHRSTHSARSANQRGPRGRKRLSQPSSSSSSVAASDKSLTSFPSFSPESAGGDRFEDPNWSKPRTRLPSDKADRSGSGVGRGSIVDSLTGQSNARSALFEDAPLMQQVPGALHQADDEHIQRLIARHGAIGLVRQISEDLAQRDAQISTLRRRADERERALRKIIRECGLSNLDLETRLRTVEAELRTNGKTPTDESGLSGLSDLSDLMSDAMQDTVVANAIGETNPCTIRASSQSIKTEASTNTDSGKGTLKGWKDYFWGTGTAKRGSRADSINSEGINPATVIRSHSSMDRRPTLQDDLFKPPEATPAKSSSRASSIQSVPVGERKTSLAHMALRLVAGGAMTTREAESRGRAVSTSTRAEALRASSTTGRRSQPRAVSVTGGPKALMAMRRSTPAPPDRVAARAQAQEAWDTMRGSPPNGGSRHESYGPVEMDAIMPPETQPPTLTHIYNNFPNSEYLTDRFGFIYDQRRKRRQREAAQMARHIRKGSRTEMLLNGRSGISPNSIEDSPSSKASVSSDGRPESPSSLEERGTEEGKTKRWQDYLKIATFPTELLSHTPSIAAPSLEVMEGVEPAEPAESPKPAIVSTNSGLIPSASTTTAVDSETTLPSQESPSVLAKEDAEPVKLLLQQLSEVHDALQREKTVRWNDFLRKVRAERRREGEAAVAAAAAVAEARYERPAMILPETRVADGEMIGVSGLGNKGKVGRAKWNEFKNLVLGGIPVAYRAKVWSECSGAAAMRIPGYYDDLVAQNGKDDDPIVVSQIQMDIHRTLTDNIFFRRGPGVQKLNEVLLAYSRRNKDVGYCQGMNLITANLLLIMPSAEDAFWILTSIIENILPHGYYDHSLLASRADQQVLRQYVTSVLPKLSAHLDSLSIELEALTFQWFLSVFTDCLSAEALFRVWDVVLSTNDGSTFLFQVALALLKLNEGNLLQCNTPAGVYTYISHQMTEHAISIDGLMQASEGLRRVVRREDVEQLREKAIQAEKDMVAARDGSRATDENTAAAQTEE
ncbi:rab-GTPase-TBC domain-containing protein [Dactylonectria macrodidyma]|uniref:Rab-GTPase-TBC domain-containing protein n=1 Tax=Dactylonectria macrodidyma TaxID=307937 RepID=A0A9P9F554_9HYPO|nr:rab-GTPase-TBC domain-containing protein [Dactylonectria macrodidyma]